MVSGDLVIFLVASSFAVVIIGIIIGIINKSTTKKDILRDNTMLDERTGSSLTNTTGLNPIYRNDDNFL